jgi:transglutaminase-like putative cysteine protease
VTAGGSPAVRLRISHTTQHAYTEPLTHAIQTLALTPRSSAHQVVEHWQLTGPGKLHESVDGYGNVVHTCTFKRRATHGRVHAEGVVRVNASPWLEDEAGLAPPWVYLRTTPLTQDHEPLRRFARDTAGGRGSEAPEPPALLALAAGVCQQIPYTSGYTTVHTTAAEAFDDRRGVCQDHAHVFIAACRSLGLPARYVSGYFHSPGAQELASHAWADVCLDVQGRRWLSIDVTHQCLIDQRHVRLAQGPDYAACAPIRGVRTGGGQEHMEVLIHITPAD